MKSVNGEIGTTLAVTHLDEGLRYLVLEMGACGICHISHLTHCIAPPSVGLVLNVGTAHIGELGGHQQIAQAPGQGRTRRGVPGGRAGGPQRRRPWPGCHGRRLRPGLVHPHRCRHQGAGRAVPSHRAPHIARARRSRRRDRLVAGGETTAAALSRAVLEASGALRSPR
ncbi:Mur ligase family protein [Streptomyces eurythermus]